MLGWALASAMKLRYPPTPAVGYNVVIVSTYGILNGSSPQIQYTTLTGYCFCPRAPYNHVSLEKRVILLYVMAPHQFLASLLQMTEVLEPDITFEMAQKFQAKIQSIERLQRTERKLGAEVTRWYDFKKLKRL